MMWMCPMISLQEMSATAMHTVETLLLSWSTGTSHTNCAAMQVTDVAFERARRTC